MSKLLFLLGSTPDLSIAELEAILPSTVTGQLVRPDVWEVDFSAEPDFLTTFSPQEIMDRLGGTVKILTEVKDLSADHHGHDDLQAEMINYFADRVSRVKIAVAELGRDHLPKVEIEKIKSALEEKNIPVRYFNDSRSGLTAAVLLHKKGIEEIYFVQTSDGRVIMAKTAAIQNIDIWTKRDRRKPYADRKKGMLPPKLARIMVNLAVRDKVWADLSDSEALTLYDPFCGTGTVLLEAAFYGFRLAASDLDVKAVLGTGENLDWLSESFIDQVTIPSLNTTTKEAANVRLSDLGNLKLNFIVTEPFLGKQTPNPSQLEGIFRGLEKLYWGAFRNWTSLLADDAQIVMIFPKVEVGHKVFQLDHLIDKVQKLGYTPSFKPLLYARPGAVVQRQIMGFKFNKEQ